MTDFGVACGICGGPVYFETCGIDGCEYAVASECLICGERVGPIKCPDHPPARRMVEPEATSQYDGPDFS